MFERVKQHPTTQGAPTVSGKQRGKTTSCIWEREAASRKKVKVKLICPEAWIKDPPPQLSSVRDGRGTQQCGSVAWVAPSITRRCRTGSKQYQGISVVPTFAVPCRDTHPRQHLPTVTISQITLQSLTVQRTCSEAGGRQHQCMCWPRHAPHPAPPHCYYLHTLDCQLLTAQRTCPQAGGQQRRCTCWPRHVPRPEPPWKLPPPTPSPVKAVAERRKDTSVVCNSSQLGNQGKGDSKISGGCERTKV